MHSPDRYGSVIDPRSDYASKAEAPARTELQQLAEGIERALKETSVVCQEVAMLRDRLFGERPAGGGKDSTAPRAVRGGLVGGLQDRADDLNAIIDRLISLVNEVSRVA